VHALAQDGVGFAAPRRVLDGIGEIRLHSGPIEPPRRQDAKKIWAEKLRNLCFPATVRHGDISSQIKHCKVGALLF
jgi:hypothetical protein